jgi:hypothetical protein
MFIGFDPLVWLMTIMNSVGGLLIAGKIFSNFSDFFKF